MFHSSIGAVISDCMFRGTICTSGTQALGMQRDHLSSAVEGPFVTPSELVCSEGRFVPLGLEFVALPVVRALSSN